MDEGNEDALTYKVWIRQIKDFDAGWPGFAVILATLVFTGFTAGAASSIPAASVDDPKGVGGGALPD